ncbi:myomesin-1 [Leptonychotes weddellii]|uniref:Myomesin-1 n=1 Tax=Leptonychotes weddellii TaxID=9713 RepID=A0A7F8R6F5_LEPWE|nr:myomesin-1 [Leptonychotes weddellii]
MNRNCVEKRLYGLFADFPAGVNSTEISALGQYLFCQPPVTWLPPGHTMSLPIYQKLHQHYDSSYRNRDLRSTMSQYQQEKKSSAIYTHGSTAYSSRSATAHRQESGAFSQASTGSYQQQASQATESTHAFAASRKTASAYDYGYSHGYVRSSLPTLAQRLNPSLDDTRYFQNGIHLPQTVGVTPYGYASKFEIHVDDKFDVSFGREGETMSLGCRVVITPEIKHFQPEIQWYRNGAPVSSSKWVQTLWSGDRATLTFSHLNKEDEGLYTIRVRMGEYYEQYSAYVFVRDADAEIEGAPASALDVVCLDANKDYIIISWKQPAVDGGSPILGYFIDKFTCHGLATGQSYIFRVRAVNAAGLSEYSQDSEVIEVKAAIGGGVSSDVWPEMNDTPGGLTDSRGGMHEASQPTFKKDALLGSKLNKPSLPSSPHNLGQTEVSKVSETVQEELTPLPRKADGKGKSKSDPLKKKKDIAAPSPPCDITCLESFRDSMVLGWKQPDKTGGAEITGYYVNYREVIDGVPGRWREANIKAVSDEAYKISNLKENMVYQFQVAAMNIAGLGEPSAVSKCFKCEEWTIAVPGPPHSVKYSEVRKTSLVLQWKPPIHSGRTPVTGYFVDLKEAKAKDSQWRGLNKAAIKNTYLRVQGLQEGVSYVFRVRAVNQAGVGKPSDLAGPVVAETRPGTKEVVVNVDDDGVISLNFECDQMAPNSQFNWSKDYVSTEDSPRLEVESKGNKTKMTFKDLGMEDLGTYSCGVTETDGIGSSYLIDEEELKRLLALSQEHKFPTVPIKSELAVEILEKGQVRFWMQAEKLSGNTKVTYIFNDKEIFEGPKYKMHIDRNTGIIEMFMEKLQDEDEGTYTFQLQDGKATGHSTLVLIGDVYKKLQKEAEFQRQEWIRKQGPHFAEYLSWEVTGECNVLLKCKSFPLIKRVLQALNLTCIVWGDPTPEVSWLKNEKPLVPDDHCSVKFEAGKTAYFTVSGVSTADSGKYGLVVKNKYGSEISDFTISVFIPEEEARKATEQPQKGHKKAK